MNYTLGLQSTLFPSLMSKSTIKVIFVQLKETKTLRTLSVAGAQWLNVGWNLKLKLPFSLVNRIGLKKGRIGFLQVWFYKSMQGHSTVAANNWKGPSRSLKSTFFPKSDSSASLTEGHIFSPRSSWFARMYDWMWRPSWNVFPAWNQNLLASGSQVLPPGVHRASPHVLLFSLSKALRKWDAQSWSPGSDVVCTEYSGSITYSVLESNFYCFRTRTDFSTLLWLF